MHITQHNILRDKQGYYGNEAFIRIEAARTCSWMNYPGPNNYKYSGRIQQTGVCIFVVCEKVNNGSFEPNFPEICNLC